MVRVSGISLGTFLFAYSSLTSPFSDIDNKQLRDDLMTMLVAGHETTAAVLTWSLFELTKNPEILKQAREEIDRVIGDRNPTFDDIKSMKYLRLVIAEVRLLSP